MKVTDMDYVGKLGSKGTVKRRILLAFIMLITFTIQNTGGLFPAPGGIHAMLLVPLTVCIAMFEREFAGLFYGLFAGAMLDAFSAKTLSYHAILLTAIGFCTGALITYLMRNNMLCAVILTAVFTFVYNSLYFVIYYAFDNVDRAVLVYFKYFFVSTLYTVIFTPLFYLIVRAVSKRLK